MKDGLLLVVDQAHISPCFPEVPEELEMSVCGGHVLGAALLDVHQVHHNVFSGQEQLGEAKISPHGRVVQGGESGAGVECRL